MLSKVNVTFLGPFLSLHYLYKLIFRFNQFSLCVLLFFGLFKPKSYLVTSVHVE